eukprot:CAMPEP_0195588660 /NCGR_PEP_ID=MMETSP0814-20130614/33045_1 /TAXON_ID=97485 /ORGANISM="Prymnesium parvum, Strain Texoma1" /LENGTH=217 /DNA_ID=CAMNT_0040727647 /DNA_START=174 /DNA_END=824 /DNA_ORIENTATION=-
MQRTFNWAYNRPANRDACLGHHEDTFFPRLHLLEFAEDIVARKHFSKDSVLMVEMRRPPQQHGEGRSARVGVGHASHRERPPHVPHGSELCRDGLHRLPLALVRQRNGHRALGDGLYLRDEPLVHSEDVVRVVAAQAEEGKDVLHRDGRGIREESELDRAEPLYLEGDLLVAEACERRVKRRGAAVAGDGAGGLHERGVLVALARLCPLHAAVVLVA